MGRKLLIKKKGKEKKGERQKKIEIDSQIRKSKFWLVRMREKQKGCLITSDLSGKKTFFDAKFILSHSFSHAN